MTLAEAEKIAEIIETADGYCRYCSADLAEKMSAAFPGFVWAQVDEWRIEATSAAAPRPE